MTQEQLGTLIGLSRRAVQDIDAGLRQSDPRLSLLERAAEALSIPIESLFSDRDTAVRECVDATEIADLRAVLHRPAAHYPMAGDPGDAPRRSSTDGTRSKPPTTRAWVGCCRN